MTLAEDQAMLTQVNQAISKILTAGQSHSFKDRQREHARLSELRDFKKELETSIARQTGGAGGPRISYGSAQW